jgi:hypothetical protein
VAAALAGHARLLEARFPVPVETGRVKPRVSAVLEWPASTGLIVAPLPVSSFRSSRHRSLAAYLI